jgi:hypothetical protein
MYRNKYFTVYSSHKCIICFFGNFMYRGYARMFSNFWNSEIIKWVKTKFCRIDLQKSAYAWNLSNKNKTFRNVCGTQRSSWQVSLWLQAVCWCPGISGVNFISILRAAFTLSDPKSAKRYWQLHWIFTLLDLQVQKLRVNMLVKSAPDVAGRSQIRDFIACKGLY